MIPTIIICSIAVLSFPAGIIAWALVRGGSGGPDYEPIENADWNTTNADLWGDHVSTGYPAFSDDETRARAVDTKLGALRKGDRA